MITRAYGTILGNLVGGDLLQNEMVRYGHDLSDMDTPFDFDMYE